MNDIPVSSFSKACSVSKPFGKIQQGVNCPASSVVKVGSQNLVASLWAEAAEAIWIGNIFVTNLWDSPRVHAKYNINPAPPVCLQLNKLDWSWCRVSACQARWLISRNEMLSRSQLLHTSESDFRSYQISYSTKSSNSALLLLKWKFWCTLKLEINNLSIWMIVNDKLLCRHERWCFLILQTLEP